jgi:hypothetical protein
VRKYALLVPVVAAMSCPSGGADEGHGDPVPALPGEPEHGAGETRREDAVVGGQQRGLGFPEVSGGGVGAAAEGGGGDLVPQVDGARGHRSHPDRAVPGVGFLVAVRVVGQPRGGPVQGGEFVDRVVPLAGRGADSADDGGVAGQSRFVRDLIIHGVAPSTVMAPNRFRKSKPGGSEFVRMSRRMTRHWRGVAFSSAFIRSGDVSVLGSWLRNVEIDCVRLGRGRTDIMELIATA